MTTDPGNIVLRKVAERWAGALETWMEKHGFLGGGVTTGTAGTSMKRKAGGGSQESGGSLPPLKKRKVKNVTTGGVEERRNRQVVLKNVTRSAAEREEEGLRLYEVLAPIAKGRAAPTAKGTTKSGREQVVIEMTDFNLRLCEDFLEFVKGCGEYGFMVA